MVSKLTLKHCDYIEVISHSPLIRRKVTVPTAPPFLAMRNSSKSPYFVAATSVMTAIAIEARSGAVACSISDLKFVRAVPVRHEMAVCLSPLRSALANRCQVALDDVICGLGAVGGFAALSSRSINSSVQVCSSCDLFPADDVLAVASRSIA